MKDKSAQAYAEALADKLRKTGRHDVRITTQDTGYGTMWSVSAYGESVFDRSLLSVGWHQRNPGTQGRQVKFYGGLADGYGKQARRTINIKTIAELEMWLGVCIEPYFVNEKTAENAG